MRNLQWSKNCPGGSQDALWLDFFAIYIDDIIKLSENMDNGFHMMES